MGVFGKTLKKCCETSSMRALPRIMKAISHFQRTIWIFALLVGLGFGGYQFVKLLIQYFGYPTSVDIKEINASPPFPDVTVCHLDINWTAIKLTETFGEDMNIKAFQQRVDDLIGQLPQESPQIKYLAYVKSHFGGYLQNVGVLDEEHLMNLTKEYFIKDCFYTKTSDMTTQRCFMNNTYKVFLDPVFGLCITMQHTEAMSLNLVLYLEGSAQKPKEFVNDSPDGHTSSVGARVIVHPHKSFPDMSYFSHFVHPGSEYDFEIVGRERISLTSPYGDCEDIQKAQTNGETFNAAFRHGFECYRRCGKQKILETCGCIFLYYGSDNISPLCCNLDNGLPELVKNIDCAFNVFVNFTTIFREICDCPKPCQEFEYDYTSRSVPWPHQTYHLSFYSKHIKGTSIEDKFKVYEDIESLSKSNEAAALEKLTKVDHISKHFARVRILNHQWKYLRYSETPLLSIESIIGSIGGLCNLWAGISFFTLIEIIDFFYQWLSNQAELQPNSKRSKSQPML